MRLPLLTALLALTAGLAAAQNAPSSDLEREQNRPSAAQEQQQAAETASTQAQKREAPGALATYADVLAHPDDVRVNMAFARAQIRAGDLKGASATLERVLLVDPDLADVRLLYAVVLYRLDDLTEAQRELALLSKAQLAAQERKERDRYAALVARRLKKTKLSGRLSAGWEYDTNRNAAPASGRRLFADTPLEATGNGARRSDTALLFLANVEARRKLPHGHEAFLDFDYFRSEQTLIKDLNLQAYSPHGGAVLRPFAGWEFTPELLFDHVLLAQTTFLRNHGASLHVERRLDKSTALFAEARDVFNEFLPTAVIPTGGDRTGIEADLTVGGWHVLNPTNKLALSFTHTTKHASQHYWAFDRESVDASHTLLLGKGMFLLSSIGLNYDRYWDPDTLVSAKHRHDETGRFSFLLGVPLGLAHPALKDLLGTVNYEYYHAFSNITNYAYTNNKVALLLTYRWELGL